MSANDSKATRKAVTWSVTRETQQAIRIAAVRLGITAGRVVEMLTKYLPDIEAEKQSA